MTYKQELESKISALADAVRDKAGVENALTLNAIKDAIEDIEPNNQKDKLIVFMGVVEGDPNINGQNKTVTVTLDNPIPDSIFNETKRSEAFRAYGSSIGASQWSGVPVAFDYLNGAWRATVRFYYDLNNSWFNISVSLYPSYLEFLFINYAAGYLIPMLITLELTTPDEVVDEHISNEGQEAL